MKKIQNLFIGFLVLLFIGSANLVLIANAQDTDYLDRGSYSERQLEQSLTAKGLFILYFNTIGEGLATSYKYIKLEFLNISANTTIYDALQKGVYLDLIKNRPVNLDLSKKATEDLFYKMILSNFEEEINYTPGKELSLKKFFDIMSLLKEEDEESNKDNKTGGVFNLTSVSNFLILNDVFLKLKSSHYNSSSFKDEDLVRGAIKGMAEYTNDKYTVYFPPTESENFQNQLNGEFEGIGAQIEMETPGKLQIVAPLSGSPAEKVGLKAGDQITKINDFVLDEKTTLQNAIDKIKGPAGTIVKLTIKRGEKTFEIDITREIINIKYVDYKKLDNGDEYIKIALFGNNIYNDFAAAIDKISKDIGGGKLIIDLRNNPGGSLSEVSNILNFFVPKGESTVNIKYKNISTNLISIGSKYNLEDKKIVILINNGSASASEIMAGTIKDYAQNVKIIGEQSYGKGSVQSLDNYYDGSSLKYTIAKWFTGKTKTGIDGIGITPDIIIKFDENAYKNFIDNQLDYAKNFRF